MVKRLAIYLKEMFPISSFIGSIIAAVAVEMVYLRMFDSYFETYDQIVLPAIVVTCVSLLIRIMDEFKDYEDDLKNFPERPLPSGRVFKKDLLFLGTFVVILIAVLSMTSMKLFFWSLVVLFYTYLMLKWFFVEARMRKSLPLAFISHHPIVLFNFTYLLIACSQINPEITLSKAIYILPVCLIFTNWEIMRKIRAPEQETAYTTYSKIFGPKLSITIALILQLIFNAAVIVIFQKLETPLVFQMIYCLIQLNLLYPSLKYFVTRKVSTPLKQTAESQILTVVFALLIAAIV